MGRIFLPQFQHNKNATVIDHAIDAKRLDAAFAEVANILNGGIDETNLADSTKFSTGSAAGAVATALAPAYSVVTLSNVMQDGTVPVLSGQGDYLGHVFSSGWRFLGGSAVGISSNSLPGLTATLSQGWGGATIGTAPVVFEAYSAGFIFKATIPAGTALTYSAGDLIVFNRTSLNGVTPRVATFTASFLVPVIT
jgi:hypothetical protein